MASDGNDTADGYTQCPSCWTVFRVAEPTLRLAGGQARCGLCGTVFNAAARWRSDLPRPQARAARLIALEALGDPPRGEVAGASRRSERGAQRQRHKPARTDGSASASASGSASRQIQGSAASRHARTPVEQGASSSDSPRSETAAPPWRVVTDAELEPTRARSAGYWVLAGSILAVMLVLQLAWFYRDALAARPALYPWVAATCQYLPCALEPPRRPDAIEVVERALQRHDERGQALVLSATLTSTAEIAQPWPQLGLRLSALNGEQLGAHWFAPDAYQSADAKGERYMAPDREYIVRVVFRRPQREVAGFELAFR